MGIILIIVVILLLLLIISSLKAGLYRIVYYISRRNVGPESSICVLSLLLLLKSTFKKGLSRRTYKSISDWNLVYEFGNRYSLSFMLKGYEFSCTVIADSLGGIDVKDLDTSALENLDRD